MPTTTPAIVCTFRTEYHAILESLADADETDAMAIIRMRARADTFIERLTEVSTRKLYDLTHKNIDKLIVQEFMGRGGIRFNLEEHAPHRQRHTNFTTKRYGAN